MKILLVNFTYGTAHHSRTYRPHLLSQQWVKMGHQVRFLGGSFNHLFVNFPEQTGEELQIEEEGVDYRLLPVQPYLGNGLGRLKAILNIYRNGKPAILRHAREFQPDIIIASTVYQTDNWAVHQAAKEVGAIALRETRDLWPMTAKEFAPFPSINPLIHLIQRAEDFACQNMDALITTLPGAFEHLKTRGLSENRFVHSHQVAMTVSDAQPLSEETVIRMRKLRDGAKLLAILPCTFAVSQHVDKIISAIAAAGPGFRLALFGKGDQEAQLRQLAKDLNAEVEFFDSIPRNQIPNALQLADVGLCYFEKPFLKYGVSPNKVSDYLAAGLPAILVSPAKQNIVEQSGGGLSVLNGSVEDFVRAIREFAEIPESLRKEMGANGRAFVEQNCSASVIAKQYLEVANEARQRKGLRPLPI